MSASHSTRLEARPAAVGAVVAYVGVTTLLAVLVTLPLLLGALPREAAGLLVPLAQLTPLLTAIACWARRREGRLGEVLALRWSWCGVALGLVAVTLVAGVQLAVGIGLGWHLRPSETIAAAALAVIPVLVMQAVLAIGEELGWRGWLASRTASWSFPAAALASSVAWTLWHLPAAYLLAGEGTASEVTAYLLAIASWAPFLLALRRATGSVWPAVATHGALNSIRVFLLQSVPDSGGVSWPVEVLGWVAWLAAAALLVRHTARRDAPAPDAASSAATSDDPRRARAAG